MHIRAISALAGLSILLALGVAPAATSNDLAEADGLVRDADALRPSKDYAAIDAKLNQALEIRRRLLAPDDVLVGDVLGRLGRNAWNKHDFATAESLFRQAVAIEERAQPLSLETAELLGDLGATLRERHKFKEAEPIVRHSIEMRRRLLPPTDLFLASGLNNLALVLVGEHGYAEAEIVMAEALNIRRTALGSVNEEVRQSESLLAAIGDKLNPGRIARQESWIFLVCLLVLAILFGQNIYVGRQLIAAEGRSGEAAVAAVPFGSKGIWLDLVLYLALFGCAGLCGYGLRLAAEALLPLYFPSIQDRDLGKLDGVAMLLGIGVFFALNGRLAKLARRLVRLPEPVSITPSPPTKAEADVRRAVSVGVIWLLAPGLVIFLGVMVGTEWWTPALRQQAEAVMREKATGTSGTL